MLVQTYLGPKKPLFQKIFGPKKRWDQKVWIKQNSSLNKFLFGKNYGPKNVGPKNIEPKVDKNRVSSGLDTLDMDKCCLENVTVTITIC